MDDRRWHPRVTAEDKVVVRVLSCPDTPDLEGRTFYCSSRDISAGGLRFCVHTPVPAPTDLELEVKVRVPEDRFVHRGTVMWSREVEEDGFHAYYLGVRFNETLGNRQVAWRTLIERKLKSGDEPA